jgi:hypothetical protein
MRLGDGRLEIMSNSRPARMLQMLRTLASRPEGMSTPDLASMHAADVESWQQALTMCGGAMRRLERRGLVCRAGTVPGGWQQGEAVVWRATGEGRAAAAVPTAAEARARVARGRIEQRERARAALTGLRDAGYGPRTPYELQLIWGPPLRACGCTMQEIADLFGVTSQTIRKRLQDRLGDVIFSLDSIDMMITELAPAAWQQEDHR